MNASDNEGADLQDPPPKVARDTSPSPGPSNLPGTSNLPVPPSKVASVARAASPSPGPSNLQVPSKVVHATAATRNPNNRQSTSTPNPRRQVTSEAAEADAPIVGTPPSRPLLNRSHVAPASDLNSPGKKL